MFVFYLFFVCFVRRCDGRLGVGGYTRLFVFLVCLLGLVGWMYVGD